MECAHIVDAFQALKIESHSIPELPDEGLILKTLYAGVCRTDVHFIDDETDLGAGNVLKRRDALGEAYKGIVLGHEICGTVLAIGSKVPNCCPIRVADTVIVYPWRGCRACEACSDGNSHLCENNKCGTEDIGLGLHAGGFSTHVAIKEWDSAIKLAQCIEPSVGCMLPCSILTSYNALLKARPTLDSGVRMRGVANLLVIGAGGLGFWAINLVKSLFCDKNVKVIVADHNEDKLTEASNAGADDAVLWTAEESIDNLVSNTTVSGYNKIDVALDFVGSPKTSEVGLKCLHHGGSLILIGLAGGQLPLTLPVMISRSLSIQSIRAGSRASLKELVDLFAVQGISNLPSLEYFKLHEINSALDKLRAGEIKTRALIKFTTENE